MGDAQKIDYKEFVQAYSLNNRCILGSPFLIGNFPATTTWDEFLACEKNDKDWKNQKLNGHNGGTLLLKGTKIYEATQKEGLSHALGGKDCYIRGATLPNGLERAYLKPNPFMYNWDTNLLKNLEL